MGSIVSLSDLGDSMGITTRVNTFVVVVEGLVHAVFGVVREEGLVTSITDMVM